MGANEKIRTGHIGINPRRHGQTGPAVRDDARRHAAHRRVRPARVASWTQAVEITSPAARTATSPMPAPSKHTYFEEVIANKDVDAVVIVTPDHWHTIPTLMACEAKQGRLRREAADHEHRRGPAHRRGGAPEQGRPAVRQLPAERRAFPGGGGAGPERRLHRAPGRPGARPGSTTTRSPEGIGNPAGSRRPRRPRRGACPWTAWTGTATSAPTEKVPYNPEPVPLQFPVVPGVFRRQDDRLGRPPHRHRAVGHGRGQEAPKTVTAAGGKYVLDRQPHHARTRSTCSTSSRTTC
jgi:hypothetical protein